MKPLPFGNYQPDERNGRVYATGHTHEDWSRGGKTSFSYAAVYLPDSGDSAPAINTGHATLADAEVAAYLFARERNLMFLPAKRGARHDR